MRVLRIALTVGVPLLAAACLSHDARPKDTALLDTDADADADADADTDTDSDTGPVDEDGDGWTVADGDCDDSRAEVNPDADEVCNNGLDDDCDGDPGECALPGSAALEDVGVRWSGAYSSWAGYSVSGAGDVNADGLADVVVGTNSGDQAFLVLGDRSPRSLALHTFITLDGDYDFGTAVAGAGDVNGDGFDDFVVGDRGWYDGVETPGRACLFLGTAEPASADVDAVAVQYVGSRDDGNAAGAGYSVSGVGDVNGDGFDDFIAGSPYWGPATSSYYGAAYLLLGSSSPTPGLLRDEALMIEGTTRAQQIGSSVAGGGDVDGDGLDDFIVGAPWEGDAAGAVFLFLGQAEPGHRTSASADASYSCNEPGTRFGWVLAGGGDVDGDGYSEMLIGAYGTDGPGAALLYLGSSTVGSRTIAEADARFDGSAQESAGSSVAFAGDVNRDGHDDMLVGAYGNGDNGPGAGATYLILGSVEPSGQALLDADSKLIGESGDYAGYSVAGAGDTNGDGTPDLLIGAFGRDEYAGAAYLVLGVSE